MHHCRAASALTRPPNRCDPPPHLPRGQSPALSGPVGQAARPSPAPQRPQRRSHRRGGGSNNTSRREGVPGVDARSCAWQRRGAKTGLRFAIEPVTVAALPSVFARPRRIAPRRNSPRLAASARRKASAVTRRAAHSLAAGPWPCHARGAAGPDRPCHATPCRHVPP